MKLNTWSYIHEVTYMKLHTWSYKHEVTYSVWRVSFKDLLSDVLMIIKGSTAGSSGSVSNSRAQSSTDSLSSGACVKY